MSTKLHRQVPVLTMLAFAMSFTVMPAAAQRMSGGGAIKPSVGSVPGEHKRPVQSQRSPQTFSREAPTRDWEHGQPSRWQHAERRQPDWGHQRGGHDAERFGGYGHRDRRYPGYGHGWEHGRGFAPIAGFSGYGWKGFGPVAAVWARGFAPAYGGWARPAFGYAPVVVRPVYHGWAGGFYNAGPARRPVYRGWGNGDGGYRHPAPYRHGDHLE